MQKPDNHLYIQIRKQVLELIMRQRPSNPKGAFHHIMFTVFQILHIQVHNQDHNLFLVLPPSNVSQRKWPPALEHTQLGQTFQETPVRDGVCQHTKPAEFIGTATNIVSNTQKMNLLLIIVKCLWS